MSTIDVIRDLFRYNAWANARVIESISTMSSPDERALSLLGHILGAGQMWYARLTGLDYSNINVHPSFTLDECRSLSDQYNSLWDAYIAANSTNEQLTATLNYRNIAGVPHTRRVNDILIHIANHATYHRGQIASSVRAAGANPPVTDFVLFAGEP